MSDFCSESRLAEWLVLSFEKKLEWISFLDAQGWTILQLSRHDKLMEKWISKKET